MASFFLILLIIHFIIQCLSTVSNWHRLFASFSVTSGHRPELIPLKGLKWKQSSTIQSLCFSHRLDTNQMFLPCAHYPPQRRVLLMNGRTIRSISEFLFLTIYFVSIGFCITRAFSYKITHNNKKRQDKKKYIYSIDMEISFTFLVLVWSSIFISIYI